MVCKVLDMVTTSIRHWLTRQNDAINYYASECNGGTLPNLQAFTKEKSKAKGVLMAELRLLNTLMGERPHNAPRWLWRCR